MIGYNMIIHAKGSPTPYQMNDVTRINQLSIIYLRTQDHTRHLCHNRLLHNVWG